MVTKLLASSLALCAALGSIAIAGPADNGYAAAMATAKQKLAAKDYPAAVAALTAAIKAKPDDADALSNLSWASYLTGDYAAAAQAGSQAAASTKSPTLRAIALFNAGHAQEALGQLRAAADSYSASLVLRKNADVQARLAGLGPQMLTAHKLLGPFAIPQAYCTARKLASDACTVDTDFDANGQPTTIKLVDIADKPAGAAFTAITQIWTQTASNAPDSIDGGFGWVSVALQVGGKWYVLADVGSGVEGHGGGHTIDAHMVGARLVLGWSEEVGRFSHDNEATTTVCGITAGAPSCVGPLLFMQQSTEEPCAKDPDCTQKSWTTTTLWCRASFRGDTLVIDHNPAKVTGDGNRVSGPDKGACEALPWGGSHVLTF